MNEPVPEILVETAREFFNLYDSKVPPTMIWARIQDWIFAAAKKGYDEGCMSKGIHRMGWEYEQAVSESTSKDRKDDK